MKLSFINKFIVTVLLSLKLFYPKIKQQQQNDILLFIVIPMKDTKELVKKGKSNVH